MYKHKLKSVIAGLAAAVLVAAGPAVAVAESDNGNSNADNKVTICHATGSQTNPYVQITPDANGVVNGHIDHQDGADIIPPFTYNDHGTTKSFDGQNWDASGQAIFNNGCVPVPTGGEGGGPKDCDQDHDNSPSSDCAPAPQKDCDNDFDNSAATECAPPTGGQGGGQLDCDNDADNSSASECQSVEQTGQVLGSTTTAGGQGSVQVSVVPLGSVNGGGGGVSAFSLTSLNRAW